MSAATPVSYSQTPTAATIEIQAPAKVNLFLEVLGLRDDGYHEIATVMQAVSLCDTLRLTDSAEPGIPLWCDRDDIPTGSNNLAVRAAELMIAETGAQRGVHIELTKRIPVAAGLGGGSSDAAAVLVGLNRLWDVGLDRGRLEQMAADIGSDVAFFIHGGTALCTGRGEKVDLVQSPHVLHYVLLVLNFGMDTRAIYKDAKLPLTENVKNVKIILDELCGGEVPLRNIASQVFNRLEEAAGRSHPELMPLKVRLCELGCKGALVSGSGSCVYGIAADAALGLAPAGEGT